MGKVKYFVKKKKGFDFKLKKETIIICLIIIIILVGNIITQNYTSKSVEILTKNLEELRKDLSTENLNKVYENWQNMHDKMAFYIEHDELEKVETDITEMKSYVESNEYLETLSKIDKAIFILKHIEDKYIFNLQNIF